MMDRWLTTPPVAFLIILFANLMIAALLVKAAFRPAAKKTDNALRGYSCGEEFEGHMIQPDYSQFYSFAFFFTVLHIVVLVLATVPVLDGRNLCMAVIYLAGSAVGLKILLRS